MKRIVAVIIACIMLAGISPVIYAEDTMDIAAETIIGLDILKGDDSGYRLNDTVKRSEFSALVIRLIGLEDGSIASDSASVFTDVPKNHWAYNVIGLAYDLKLINGKSENLFAPDDIITTPEAVKIVVSALGYGDYAFKNGGYPDGYYDIAVKQGILKRLSVSDGVLTRGDVCDLFYASLDVPILDGYPEVERIQERTILTEYLDKQVIEGVVLGTFYHPNGYNIGENQVNISGKLYTVSPFAAEKADTLLGVQVRCYYDDSNINYEICYLKAHSYIEEVYAEAEDILDETDLTKFVYFDDSDRKRTKELSSDITVYYNGPAVPFDSLTASLLKPATGSVKLRDTDSDGTYDVAVVFEYENYILKLYDGEIIYDKYSNPPLELYDFDAEDISVRKDGEKTELENLLPNDVLTIAKSLGEDKISIDASSEYIIGNVTQIGDNKYTIKDINGAVTELEAAQNYKNAVANNEKDCEKLEIGRNLYHIALDVTGKIADVKLSEESGNIRTYGYLNNAAASFSSGEVEILTQANKFEVFTLADNVTFGRSKLGDANYTVARSTFDDVVGYLFANGKNGGVKKQLVQYSLNSEGKLNQLYLADLSNNSGDTEYFTRTHNQEDMVYRENILNQMYYVDEATIVFSVPMSGEYKGFMSAGKYNKYFSNGKSVVVDMYNADDGIPDVVVLSDRYIRTYETVKDGYETVIDYVNSPVMYVNKVYSAMDENGNASKIVEGYQNGELTKVFVSDELASNSENISLLKKGVAIQYETNSAKVGRAETSDEQEAMVLFKIMYDFTDSGIGEGILWEYDTIIDDNAEITTMWSTIEDADDKNCTMMIDGSRYVIGIHGGTVVLEYDDKDGFSLINALKIVKGKKAFIRQRYLNTREIVLY